MSNIREEIAHNLDKYLIGLDDTFAFKCRCCGKCCKNRDDILLNSRDLFNIAVALELTIAQTIEKYCEIYIGRESKMPIVRLKPQGTNMACPLLEGKRCVIHAKGGIKPVVCAAFPLGRVFINAEAVKDDVEIPMEPNTIGYILNEFSCGSVSKKHTVRSWLEKFGIPADDVFFIRWNEVIFKVVTIIMGVDKRISNKQSKAFDILYDGVFSLLYANYDTKQDFMPQFEANAAKLLEFCGSINGVIVKFDGGNDDV